MVKTIKNINFGIDFCLLYNFKPLFYHYVKDSLVSSVCLHLQVFHQMRVLDGEGPMVHTCSPKDYTSMIRLPGSL